MALRASKSAVRTAKSFSLDPDIVEYVAQTRATRSASERVNELLRRAIAQEQADRLAREAAAFFSKERAGDREEAREFQKAAMKTQVRD